MMTDREVMQQALERLALYHAANGFAADAEAIAALRARLAEPETCKAGLQVEEVEPVAFRWKVKINDAYGWVVGHSEPPADVIEQQPLYTAPPARRPLTDEEIHFIARHECFLDFDDEGKAVELFARAIERAHKIGGNDD
jgi:hypothetical protein